ncbi:uncharacterized protein LOC130868464 [Chionomys nivalis]|uniref:uncharacterized protein LOC130868464 n=1 Tax=Chionomys nivalis TaxID=269649 RepID=UPI00259586FA|nr:uncharacterized protein LOC130868464 [Chionomys nivalis]
MEQQDKVDVACGPSDSECNMGNETGAPLVVGPGLRGRASRRGRGRSCTTRTQARPLEQKDKVGVCFWPRNSECSMENKTGAPMVVGPGLRGPANHRGRGHRCATRTQARTMDQSNQVNVCFWPSNMECKTGNETGAPLGIEPGLRGHASRPGRGRGHGHATRTEAREHSEALPALGSEKRMHGALLKRRETRLLRTTEAVAGKPLCQGKKSSAKARGHGELPSASIPLLAPSIFTCTQRDNDLGPAIDCFAFHGAPGPVTSDQASVSATFQCEEILEAAAALMTLKNSSWSWRQTHS